MVIRDPVCGERASKVLPNCIPAAPPPVQLFIADYMFTKETGRKSGMRERRRRERKKRKGILNARLIWLITEGWESQTSPPHPPPPLSRSLFWDRLFSYCPN